MQQETTICKHCDQPIHRNLDTTHTWSHVNTSGKFCTLMAAQLSALTLCYDKLKEMKNEKRST